MPTIFSRGAASALALGFGKVSSILTDSFFKYVTLLLPGNGTNAAQNNTFLDSSSNNFTITRNGNTTQGTFSPYGSNWSMNTSTTGSYLTIPQNTAFAFGTGNFTIEAWVMRNEGSRQQAIVDCRGAGGGAVGVYFFLTAQAYLTIFDGTSNIIGGSVATVMPGYQGNGLWTHVAATRSGTTTRLFINGTVVATLNGDTRNYANGAGGTLIARQFGSTANDWIGWISNVRIVKGTALYTANFTPSTTPLTAVSGTSLLTCQSNRFVDNSGNNFTITPTGTPSVQRYSPFSPTASYSAATVGGSGYFDGTGDYLSVADATALDLSGDWTIEGWFYIPYTASAIYMGFVTKWASGQRSYYITIETGTRFIYTSISTNGSSNSDLSSPTSAWNFNCWNHLALVSSGGGATRTIYVNGINVASSAMPGTPFNGTSTVQISGDGVITSGLNGYLSDVRIVKGTAVYTAGFTPPTAPLTDITNTSLLCSMTNAGIIDNAMMNNLETVGNAQISTTQSKFGGSSMYFDGTGDKLVQASSQNISFSTGDFTFEAWIYSNNVSNASQRGFVQTSDTAGGLKTTYTTGIMIFFGSPSNGAITANVGGTSYSSAGGAVSASTWTHIALTRASGTVRLFVNGTSVASGSGNNINLSGQFICIGGYNSDTFLYDGYIDDLRITKGYARYTANFTAPTAAFPTS